VQQRLEVGVDGEDQPGRDRAEQQDAVAQYQPVATVGELAGQIAVAGEQ
jgi:hypothetical protein